MTTWAPAGPVGVSRRTSAGSALFSWGSRLAYAGVARLHVADDGSTLEGYGHGVDEPPASWWAGPTSFSRQERRGVGASLNAGFRAAFEVSPIAAYFVDDWLLQERLDLTPWVDLLLRDASVGMVRLGPPHPWIAGAVEMFEEGWGLRLERHHFAFAHRPALYHQRFLDAFGPFPEEVNALECERLYAERYAEHFAGGFSGPDIVYALPHPWEHVGRSEVGDIEPVEAAR